MNPGLAVITTSLSLLGCGAGFRTTDGGSVAAERRVAEETESTTNQQSVVTPLPSLLTAASNSPECLLGTWAVEAVGDMNGLDGLGGVNGVTITFGPADWALDADDGAFTGILDGGIVDTTISGTASGTYTTSGDAVSFATGQADGTAESALGEATFEEVVGAIVPTDPLRVTCDDNGGAQLVSTGNTALVLVDHERDPSGGIEVAGGAPATDPGVPEPSPADCMAGVWTLATVSYPELADAPGEITGVTVTFGAAAGDTAWSLVAENATIRGVAAGAPAEATISGTAAGHAELDGDIIELVVDEAEGTVDADWDPAATFVDVLVMMHPDATSALNCDDSTLTLAGDTAILTFDRAADSSTSTTDAAVQTTPEPASTSAGGVTIDDAAGTVDIDCDGRPVAITGAMNTVELNGDCPTVTVTGSSNDVTIERVDEINVTGTSNDITWESGVTADEPSVSDTGVGNKVNQVNQV